VAAFGAGTAQSRDNAMLDGFTRSPYEHFINEIDKPFVVRAVRGVITCFDPLPGALVEIRGPGNDRTIRHAITNKSGRFAIRHAPRGAYRFKITYSGNQSEVGTIIVVGSANKQDEIRIGMRPGV